MAAKKIMLIIILIFELLTISTAWTACVLAPMPYNIIIPVSIAAIELIIRTIAIYRHFKRRGKARRKENKPGRENVGRNGRSSG